jgi:D-glycero-D-manno-heptose 1,7-bisphosphate phosphatase
MIVKAVKELNIDLKRSYLIGDRYKDIEFAHNLHIKSGLVMTGYGKGEYEYQRHLWKVKPNMIGENLLEIVKMIYQQQANRKG